MGKWPCLSLLSGVWFLHFGFLILNLIAAVRWDARVKSFLDRAMGDWFFKPLVKMMQWLGLSVGSFLFLLLLGAMGEVGLENRLKRGKEKGEHLIQMDKHVIRETEWGIKLNSSISAGCIQDSVLSWRFAESTFCALVGYEGIMRIFGRGGCLRSLLDRCIRVF